MNKKLLLASLVVSAMGFSSLFAEEEVVVKSEQCLSCDKCDNLEEKILDEEEIVPELSCIDKTEQVKDDELFSCDCDKRLQANDEESI